MILMPSLDFIADSLDGAKINWKVDLNKFDMDGDGDLDADDCPFQYGSPEAKLWWKNILEPNVESQVTPELKAKYGDDLVGMYHGKPLIPGVAGPGQGDFNFLVDKIRITQGLDFVSATKIAGKVNFAKYGG